MQRQRSDAHAAKQCLDMAMARIAAIGRLHRHLNEHRAVHRVDFRKLIGELSSDICASTGMECEVDAESILLRGEKACKLVILINELNAYKHGYDGRDGGGIRVECRAQGYSQMRLTVSDHGRGLPAGFDPQQTHGLGLSVVSSIVRELDGEMQVRNGPGAAFDIILPVP